MLAEHDTRPPLGGLCRSGPQNGEEFFAADVAAADDDGGFLAGEALALSFEGCRSTLPDSVRGTSGFLEPGGKNWDDVLNWTVQLLLRQALNMVDSTLGDLTQYELGSRLA